MKQLIRSSCLALVLVMLLSLWVLPAYADNGIDPSHTGSITLQASCSGTILPGMRYSLYRVADVSGTAPSITLVEPYASFPISVEGMTVEDWYQLSSTLSSFVQAHKTSATREGTTDDTGTVVFSDLPVGMYLIRGETLKIGATRYEATPYLLCVPNRVDHTWSYDLVSRPKIISSDIEFISLDVMKVWEDFENYVSRPTRVIVQLLRDGEEFDQVELSYANRWRYTWENLDADYEWTVTETPVPGYTMRIERVGYSYRIINQRNYTPPPGPPPYLPQTGLVWWPAAVLGGLGCLFLLLAVVTRRSSREGSKDRYYGKH